MKGAPSKMNKLLSKPSLKLLYWLSLVLVGSAATFLIPSLLAYQSVSEAIVLKEITLPSLSNQAHSIVIARREERTSEEDQTPFRNSRLGIYANRGDRWELVSTIFDCRSSSTCELRPEDPADFGAKDEGDTFTYGYVSVPFGAYSLKKTRWKTGDVAFLLSDWGDSSGQIKLREQQILRTVEFYVQDGKLNFRDLPGEKRKWIKRESYLHPTHTKYWSLGDSKGCLNLFKCNDNPTGKDDWDIFINQMKNLDMLSSSNLLVLFIVPFNAVEDSSGEMKSELDLNFYSPFTPYN